MVTFSNPIGLLALFGVPAVLAIHLLQRRPRRVIISTWFLLEQVQRESAAGRRLDRFRTSLPLWLQLSSVLLLAWVLAEPRYASPQAVCRVAVVVDASASMHAFRQELAPALRHEIGRLCEDGARLELSVVESSPRRARLYAGSSRSDALQALGQWMPSNDGADPTLALRAARSAVGEQGHVIWLTDTPSADALPAGVRLLAIGSQLENVGCCGVSVVCESGIWRWRVIVRNHGHSIARRQWSLVAAGFRSPPRELELPAGGVTMLQADWPDGVERAWLELTADRFELDDVMPMMRPTAKTLVAALPAEPTLLPIAEKLTRAMDATPVASADPAADFRWISSKPGPLSAEPRGNAVVLLAQPEGGRSWLRGGFSAANHAMMEGLNWQTLLIQDGAGLESSGADEVLLWQDQTPRIWLRQPAEGGRQLVCNIDPQQSNLLKQPAFVVLLHRFSEMLRREKRAPQTLLLETGQTLGGIIDASTARHGLCRSTAVTGEALPAAMSGTPSTAPRLPGFFEVDDGGGRILTAAVGFADSAEADFSSCASSSPMSDSRGSQRFALSRPDPLRPIWLLLLLACLLGSWWVRPHAKPAEIRGE